VNFIGRGLTPDAGKGFIATTILVAGKNETKPFMARFFEPELKIKTYESGRSF
jgi:hypothetical protein